MRRVHAFWLVRYTDFVFCAITKLPTHSEDIGLPFRPPKQTRLSLK